MFTCIVYQALNREITDTKKSHKHYNILGDSINVIFIPLEVDRKALTTASGT